MGNTSVINGFSALNAEKYTPKNRLLTNGATVSNGDILYMADAGTVDETVNAGKLIGLAATHKGATSDQLHQLLDF